MSSMVTLLVASSITCTILRYLTSLLQLIDFSTAKGLDYLCLID